MFVFIRIRSGRTVGGGGGRTERIDVTESSLPSLVSPRRFVSFTYSEIWRGIDWPRVETSFISDLRSDLKKPLSEDQFVQLDFYQKKSEREERREKTNKQSNERRRRDESRQSDAIDGLFLSNWLE